MVTSPRELLINVSFVVGCVGNIASLYILWRSARLRNPRHVLMLRCLAANDLAAEVGMLILMHLRPYGQYAADEKGLGGVAANETWTNNGHLLNDTTVVPSVVHVAPLVSKYWLCVFYVCFRAFGLGSGCVAMVMAVERWLALTRPFIYQQYVTYDVLKRTIFGLWSLALLLTYAPLFGFGLFYNKGRCCRYRDATELKDIAYAYIFLVFGTTLCACIVCCNSLVFCELAKLGKKQDKILIRRVSRAIIKANCRQSYATAEELAFAKLMAFLCIIFVACWLPQMISIPLAQLHSPSTVHRVIFRVADLLMCVYFTLDPYVYVLHRYIETTRHCFWIFTGLTGGNKPPPATVTTSLVDAGRCRHTTTTSTTRIDDDVDVEEDDPVTGDSDRGVITAAPSSRSVRDVVSKLEVVV